MKKANRPDLVGLRIKYANNPQVTSLIEYILQLEAEKTDLMAVISSYDQAAIKFVKKVETGRARSVETYADLKACLRLSQKKESK